MKPIPVRRHIKTPAGKVDPAEIFSIRDLRSVMGQQERAHELHRHDFYFLLALESGSGTHEIDFEKHAVRKGQVFVLRPGQVHRLHLQPNSRGYLVEFSKEFYPGDNREAGERLRKAAGRNLCKPLPAGFVKIAAALELIFREYGEKQPGYKSAVKAGMDILFIEILRQSNSPGKQVQPAGSYEQSRYEELTALLESEISRLQQGSQYAARMHLSLYQLNRICKIVSGKTVSELLQAHRLLESKRYLLATTLQVKEIASLLGFEDASYFTRFFRKQTGKTPDAFRQHPR